MNDYASKLWAGLIRSYYIPRSQRFVDFITDGTTAANGANAALSASLLAFEEAWQLQIWGEAQGESFALPVPGGLQRTIAKVVKVWPTVFARAPTETWREVIQVLGGDIHCSSP